MDMKCNQIQDILIDIFYEENKMTDSIREHLEICHSCSAYWTELQEMNAELEDTFIEAPIEYTKIREAFHRAEIESNQKATIGSMILFFLTACLIFTVVGTLALSGYLNQILYFQVFIYLVAPIIIPIFIKLRGKKEGYNGGA